MKRGDKKLNFKKGAASFYIVAFSTLILIIVAVSFIGIIVSEIARTSNDDLSQSAYDSALAGVEDAKLAFYNYQKCIEENPSLADTDGEAPDDESELSCGNIVYLMKNNDCDMVAKILGRKINEDEDGEKRGVLIQEESEGGNNMQQMYTCVTMKTDLSDYRATLSASDPVKVIPAKFDAVAADNIQSVTISWFSENNASMMPGGEDSLKYSDLNSNGIFDGSNEVVPTIALGMVQTGNDFSLSDFDVTKGEQTDRGMIYLVPTNDKPNRDDDGKYKVTEDNVVPVDGLLKSNDKRTKKLPYVVSCGGGEGQEFICSATVELPKPIGGTRNNDTFMFIVALPYGPSTDFALEFECGEDESACTETVVNEDGTSTEKQTKPKLKDVQVSIDSTGRANDLYRRVEVRLSPANAANPYALYGIQLLGGSEDGNLLEKNLAPTIEHNFK